MLRVLFWFTMILLLVYGLYVGYFYQAQRQLVFPRHLLPSHHLAMTELPGWQQLWFELPMPATPARVEGWYLAPAAEKTTGQPAPAMIITHGNGELIDQWATRVAELHRQGIGVLLVEYPGYGRSTGEPTQATIAATLTVAYDWLIAQPAVDRERILLFGFSVGGGAISTLAAQRPSAALILMSTFRNMQSMARRFYLPGYLVRDRFDTLAMIRGYTQPVLLIHGLHDTTIPHTNALALHAAAPNSQLQLLPCGHADCVPDWREFWRLVLDFLHAEAVIPQPAASN